MFDHKSAPRGSNCLPESRPTSANACTTSSNFICLCGPRHSDTRYSVTNPISEESVFVNHKAKASRFLFQGYICLEGRPPPASIFQKKSRPRIVPASLGLQKLQISHHRNKWLPWSCTHDGGRRIHSEVLQLRARLPRDRIQRRFHDGYRNELLQ